MEVILKEDYPSLGYVGDKVSVRGGFARNFLIPRGIAVETSSRNARVLNHRLAGINAKKAKLKAQAEELKGKLEQIKLEFTLKLGARGKSFGSLTMKDLEAAINANGFTIDRKQLRLQEVIRGAGEYQVGIKLHSEVIAAVKFNVIAQKSEPKVGDDEKREGKSKRGRGKKEAAEGEGETPADGEETAGEETASEETAAE